MADYRFVLSGVTLPGTSDLFNVWEVPPSGSPPGGRRSEDVSFDTSVAAAPVEPFDRPRTPPTWHVQLPASPDGARSILDAQSAALRRSESDLAQARRRLAQIGAGAGVSFEAAAGPEAELWAALSAIESPVSFGLRWRDEETGQRETYQQWKSFLEQVGYMVSHYARIETEVAGTLVGHTAVGWTGDFDTLWEPGITPPFMSLHRQTVHLALDSRIALLRLLTIVGTGAVKLALRLTVPGAQLLLLPAVWRFVRDVLAELRESWPKLKYLY